MEQAQAELSHDRVKRLGAVPRYARGLARRGSCRTRIRFSISRASRPGNSRRCRSMVSLLLLIVALNVAILIYARTATRQGEIAVRTALGASRGRLVAQLFIEALVLCGVSAVAGVLLAQVGLRMGHAIMETEGRAAARTSSTLGVPWSGICLCRARDVDRRGDRRRRAGAAVRPAGAWRHVERIRQPQRPAAGPHVDDDDRRAGRAGGRGIADRHRRFWGDITERVDDD